MVRHYHPQSGNISIIANTIYLPQNFLAESGGIVPGVDGEIYEETLGVFDGIIYDDGVDAGSVEIVGG